GDIGCKGGVGVETGALPVCALLPPAAEAHGEGFALDAGDGVYAVTRIKGEPFAVSIGGVEQQVTHTGPRYSALYEIEGPHVLVSAAWAQAVEMGRWPSQVRPYTRNRQHALYQVC